MKDVDHHLQVIEHDPLARRKSIDRHRPDFMFLLEARLNLARNRFQLRFGSGRTDDKKIGKTRNATQIPDNNVFGLLI
jgi:hypothetical protein